MFLPGMKDNEIAEFENECFRDWLNHIDALVGYDERRQQPVSEWRWLFDQGECERDAIAIALWGKGV